MLDVLEIISFHHVRNNIYFLMVCSNKWCKVQ